MGLCFSRRYLIILNIPPSYQSPVNLGNPCCKTILARIEVIFKTDRTFFGKLYS